MQVNKVFIISCQYFGGFTISVDINLFEDKKQIILHVLSILKESLDQLSLQSLIDLLQANRDNYHIHDFDFGHFFINDGPFYICNHCNDITNPNNSIQDISFAIPESNYSLEELTPNAPLSSNEVTQENDHDTTYNHLLNFYNSVVNDDYQRIDNCK